MHQRCWILWQIIWPQCCHPLAEKKRFVIQVSSLFPDLQPFVQVQAPQKKCKKISHVLYVLCTVSTTPKNSPGEVSTTATIVLPKHPPVSKLERKKLAFGTTRGPRGTGLLRRCRFCILKHSVWVNSLDLGPPCVPPWDPVELTAPWWLKQNVNVFARTDSRLPEAMRFVFFFFDLQVIEMSYEKWAASNSYISISITIYNELVWVIKFFPVFENRTDRRPGLDYVGDQWSITLRCSWAGEHPMLNHLWLEWRSICLHAVLYMYLYL